MTLILFPFIAVLGIAVTLFRVIRWTVRKVRRTRRNRFVKKNAYRMMGHDYMTSR